MFEQLDALAAGFTVLSRYHVQPPEDLAGFWELLDEWPLQGTESAAAGLALMRAARDASETPDAVREDHARLYGTMAVAKVPPYESVHRGEDRLVFDEHTLQVRESYRALSLQTARLHHEPDDHIGLELEFVAHTCLRALDALELGPDNDVQRYLALGGEFLREHLQQWAPEMLRSVVEAAETRFMAGLAELSLGALESYSAFVDANTSEVL